jgi:16S rRNA processing protein RimM
LVKFEGIDTREAAEGLRGPLYVTTDELRELDESEYWEHELLGCNVETPAGVEVGEITALIPGPAQDLLEVQTKAGPRYVPAVKDLIVEVDVAARRVVVDAPPGLLD